MHLAAAILGVDPGVIRGNRLLSIHMGKHPLDFYHCRHLENKRSLPWGLVVTIDIFRCKKTTTTTTTFSS